MSDLNAAIRFTASCERLTEAMQSVGSAFQQFDRTMRRASWYAAHYRMPAPVKPALRGRRHGW